MRKKWKTKRGELWVIKGEETHRMLCGDATNKSQVALVAQGNVEFICLTDPPYGVGREAESGKNAYESFEDTQDNLVVLAKAWFPIAQTISKIVVFSPGVTNAWHYPQSDWILCWYYGGGQLRSPWGFNCWQPFLCYGKDPSLASGNGGRPDAVNLNTPANASGIGHPCPKPLPLWHWLIKRMSFSSDDVLFDPFLGSGTTMLAAEQLNRRCYGMEIEPKYCAVILQRMEDAGCTCKLVDG
jgi:DNA modification methylase